MNSAHSDSCSLEDPIATIPLGPIGAQSTCPRSLRLAKNLNPHIRAVRVVQSLGASCLYSSAAQQPRKLWVDQLCL